MRTDFKGLIVVVILIVATFSRISGEGLESGKQADDPELSTILKKATARARQYSLDLRHFAWTSVVRYEVLDKQGHSMEKGNPTEVTYEMTARFDSTEGDSLVAVREEPQLKLVDGKAVKPNYKLPWYYNSLPGQDPLWVVLSNAFGGFSFSNAGKGELRGNDVLMLDVRRPPQETTPRALWGRDRYLLSVAGVSLTGRVWIDPETFDVLQIDFRAGPVEIAQSDKNSKKMHYERKWTMRYKSVTFNNPREVFQVPDSVEIVTLLNGVSPAVRRTVYTYKDFRRFSVEIETTPIVNH